VNKKPIKIEMPLNGTFPTVNSWFLGGEEPTLVDASYDLPGNFEIVSSIFDISNMTYKNKNWMHQMAGFFMIFGYTDLLIEEERIRSVKNKKGEMVFQLVIKKVIQ